MHMVCSVLKHNVCKVCGFQAPEINDECNFNTITGDEKSLQ